MRTNEFFDKWWQEHGVRFYTDAGHQEYMKHAFRAGFDLGRAEQANSMLRPRKMPEPFYQNRTNYSYNWK